MSESPAETLRRAAEKMRGLANAATPSPWRTHDTYVHDGGYTATVLAGDGNDTRPVAWAPSFSNDPNEIDRQAYPDAIYIAAVHPGVMLLIADQWDAVADLAAISLKHWEDGALAHVSQPTAIETTAIAAAREFLGEAVVLGDDEDGYETDADPKPRDGDRGTCAICGGEIHYWEYTRWNGVEDDVLDSRWSHVEHPADGHDAEIGGPA